MLTRFVIGTTDELGLVASRRVIENETWDYRPVGPMKLAHKTRSRASNPAGSLEAMAELTQNFLEARVIDRPLTPEQFPGIMKTHLERMQP